MERENVFFHVTQQNIFPPRCLSTPLAIGSRSPPSTSWGVFFAARVGRSSNSCLPSPRRFSKLVLHSCFVRLLLSLSRKSLDGQQRCQNLHHRVHRAEALYPGEDDPWGPTPISFETRCHLALSVLCSTTRARTVGCARCSCKRVGGWNTRPRPTPSRLVQRVRRSTKSKSSQMLASHLAPAPSPFPFLPVHASIFFKVSGSFTTNAVVGCRPPSPTSWTSWATTKG